MGLFLFNLLKNNNQKNTYNRNSNTQSNNTSKSEPLINEECTEDDSSFKIGQKNWDFVVSSGDGLKLAAIEASGGIFLSKNGGETWVKLDGPTPISYWRSLAISSNGDEIIFIF